MKNDSVDDVIQRLEITSIVCTANYSCTFSFPWSTHKEKDGVKDILYIELQTINLPTSYLRLANVLSGGMMFASCMAAPK
jgi:hypothetical protein